MKKGFTLTELLVVIALLGILVAFVVPNLLKTFTDNKGKLTTIQKKQITEAVELYLEDYCITPIGSNTCPFDLNDDSSDDLSLNNLVIAGYFKESKCSGNIKIEANNINLDGITCEL